MKQQEADINKIVAEKLYEIVFFAWIVLKTLNVSPH